MHDNIVVDEPMLRVRTAFLDHKITCLGYALEEPLHVGVRKQGLDDLGLPTGRWLRHLKLAVLSGQPDDTPFDITWRVDGTTHTQTLPLGTLRDQCLLFSPGQRVGYITDIAFNPHNISHVVPLVEGADPLFIEASFTADEAERAAEHHHLTTAQAGELARRARVKRVKPFHFSPRHSEQRAQMLDEVRHAWLGHDPLDTSQ